MGTRDIERIAITTAAARKVKPGLGSIVYVYTPQNVRRCNGVVEPQDVECEDDRQGRDFIGRCGYHDYANVGNNHLILVYVPHPGSSCHARDGSQRFPNDRAADAAINLTSHFQMEAITDPLFNAWREDNDDVMEISSECDHVFGPRLPGKKGNSHYNGHTYDVHAMASNKDEGCVVGSRTSGF